MATVREGAQHVRFICAERIFKSLHPAIEVVATVRVKLYSGVRSRPNARRSNQARQISESADQLVFALSSIRN